MNTDFIKGIIPPIVTPITADEKPDEQTLRNHIDYMITAGISGILAFGSNGEFYMLEEDEMEKILKIIVHQTGDRVPVYMGVGAVRTGKCVRLARLGVRLGARGVSVLQPMFIKPTDDELTGHFEAIAKSVPDVPVLLYNNPGRTGYPISQAVVEYLARRLPNIVGIKDSSGDLTETMEFIRRNRELGFKVLVGKDTLIYPGLEVGAVGAVCSTANYMPELACPIYDLFMAGNKKAALEAQYRLNPIRLMTDKSTFPVAAKDCANLRGRELGGPYLPNKPSPPAQMENLRRELEKAGLLAAVPG
ncbi:MAG: dihydrodipicolinate synthase family protein [Treponema sp.]|jgi:4-hydroxy-tetrahydrodipicolinate synthase|nr:dihydrodipicolinate synthase family protein [Treponema sp.]